jgi:ribonuclease HI
MRTAGQELMAALDRYDPWLAVQKRRQVQEGRGRARTKLDESPQPQRHPPALSAVKVVVHFDGACEPRNPGGTMGFGAVICEGKTEIWRHSGISIPEEWSGQTSSNLAEYLALAAALRWLLEAGRQDRDIEIHGDSQLVINQMFGNWRIKTGAYVPIANEAKGLLKQFSCIQGRWIPRDANQVADDLSKAELLKRGIKLRTGASI